MFAGRDGFVWWIGVVEDIEDPLLLGRAKVRIFGYHPRYTPQAETTGDSNNTVPIADLPWVTVVMPPNLPNFYGRLRLGEWVLGFFLDGVEAQEPAILGYIPGLNTREGSTETFGKYDQTVKTFNEQHSASPNNPSQYTFVTPAGQFLRLSDKPEQKESLFYNQGNFYLQLLDANGNQTLTLIHPKNGYFQIDPTGKMNLKSGGETQVSISTGGTIGGGANSKLGAGANDIIVSGSGGQYSLTEELQRIINSLYPPPPPPRRGGGCFTGETLVTMWNGTKKRIDEIQVGELVQSGIHSQPSKVLFVEKLRDTMLWKELYTPSGMHEPFATPNHMLFVNKEWVAIDIDLYDWMPKLKKIENPITRPTTGEPVYNLWLEGGDGTYFVNGYLTHSIMYDGGWMRRAWERGFVTHEQVMMLMYEFTIQGDKMTYGAYLINKIVGMVNQKHFTQLIAKIMMREKEYLPRRFIIATMRAASSVMRLIKRRK